MNFKMYLLTEIVMVFFVYEKSVAFQIAVVDALNQNYD